MVRVLWCGVLACAGPGRRQPAEPSDVPLAQPWRAAWEVPAGRHTEEHAGLRGMRSRAMG